jgi:hypothetical protein
MSARRSSAVWTLVLTLVAAPGSAEEPAIVRTSAPSSLPTLSPTAGPRLEWLAPADCPTRGEVLAQVATLGKTDRLRWDRFDVIRAAIERRGPGWSLALEFVAAGGVRRRDLQSARCTDLAEAAAVAIVLAHQSGGDEAATDGESSAPPEVTTAPPAGSLEPSPGAGAAPAARAGAERDPASSNESARDDGRDALPDLTLAVGAAAALDPTTLGSAAFGAVAGVEVGLGSIAAALYGAGFPSATTRVGPAESIELALWTAGLRGCYRWGRGLDTCAVMELGQVTGEGIGLDRPGRSRDRWAAPGLSIGFTSTPFDGFGITTRLSAFHPLVRGRYRIDESDVVHRVPAVSVRASLGIELPLL